MNVDIKLDEDQLKAALREVVRDEIRAILNDQLDNIVAGEMAKMRLFKPGSSDLSTMITNKVDTACSRAMGRDEMRSVMRSVAHEIAKNRASKIVNAAFDRETIECMKERLRIHMRGAVQEVFS